MTEGLHDGSRPRALNGRRAFILLTGLLALAAAGPAAGQDTITNPPPSSPPTWSIACFAAKPDDPMSCRLTEELFSAEVGGRVLAVDVSRPPSQQGGLEMTLAMPHGIYLPEGIKIKIGENDGFSAVIESSNSSGIVARIAVADAFASALKKGQTMTVTITNMQGKKIQIPVALAGYAAGMARMLAIK